MAFKWWRSKGEEKNPASAETAKIGVQGKQLHVNPSPDISLARLENRLATVKQLLKTKFPHGHKRYDEFMRIKGRLQAQIKLKKGEF